jgi:[ribosomal protein S5]-alanine N-acetyltransferase
MRALSGRNVLLQPQAAEHAAEMFAVLGDPALYEYENEPPLSVHWLQERFARPKLGGAPSDRRLDRLRASDGDSRARRAS